MRELWKDEKLPFIVGAFFTLMISTLIFETFKQDSKNVETRDKLNEKTEQVEKLTGELKHWKKEYWKEKEAKILYQMELEEVKGTEGGK